MRKCKCGTYMTRNEIGVYPEKCSKCVSADKFLEMVGRCGDLPASIMATNLPAKPMKKLYKVKNTVTGLYVAATYRGYGKKGKAWRTIGHIRASATAGILHRIKKDWPNLVVEEYHQPEPVLNSTWKAFDLKGKLWDGEEDVEM